MHALGMFLPRWLDSLARVDIKDPTKHAVVFALANSAYSTCTNLEIYHKHQCILDPHWPGDDSQYQFAQDWYGPVTC